MPNLDLVCRSIGGKSRRGTLGFPSESEQLVSSYIGGTGWNGAIELELDAVLLDHDLSLPKKSTGRFRFKVLSEVHEVDFSFIAYLYGICCV
ncbi:hypothetical protein E3T28_09355 [Cryobacterium sinapicolor]|uniref:Uncharacterized protein n=1 Tax=Cryobacterium sinapicolor TaxID=1259236 RepID=A0ABY2J4H8_9MICO|nr:hypothetical protein [Cryobacterium sinapicolor]TFC98958.1 hypothetical protein E3T28_09355 [Cryobacterium sinapicolor]